MKRGLSGIQRGFIVSAVIIAVLLPTLTRLEVLQAEAFCVPAARMASFFLSAPARPVPGGCVIETAVPIEVTTACSAIRFFVLATAVLAGLAVEQRRRLPALLLIPPAAYALTIGANSARILCTRYVDELALRFMPPHLQPGLHALTGALVFMSALTAVYLLIWKGNHQREQAAPAP